MRKIFYLVLLLYIFINLNCQDNNLNSKVLSNVLWSMGDSSYYNFRIPSIIVTQKETVLAFCEGRVEDGDFGDIDLLVKRSEDNGLTWKAQEIVWDDKENTCGNPCPVIDQTTGRIILFMTWNLGVDKEKAIKSKEADSTRVPFMCFSNDDGLTWSEPKSLYETCKNPEWGWYATGPGIGIQLKSVKFKNRLVIPCNNSYEAPRGDDPEKTEFVYGCHLLLSDDGGDNWRMSELISPLVNESQVVELTNGNLLMNMRSCYNKRCRAISYSEDGGETWSEIQNASDLSEPKCQASIIDFGLYNDDQMYLFSNPATTLDRRCMTIKTSFDDCKSWSNSKLIYAGMSGYSCLVRLSNGNIGLLFECGKEKKYDEQILFVSFSPDELFKPKVLLSDIDK